MPLINRSKYTSPPYYLVNGHLETIIPSLWNKVEEVNYQRERLELSDGDFLDLDWLQDNNDKLVILSHGMEGSSNRHYVKRSAKFFHERDWDVLAWNTRGCGGTINRLATSSHHGTTQDLQEVISHGLSIGRYQSIVLVGFSMGGSMVSKYLSVADEIDERVKGGVAFSVSCDLHETTDCIEETIGVYKKQFLKKLKYKLQLRQEIHEEMAMIDIASIATLEQYYEAYAIPFGGYIDLVHFYQDASCLHYLPTLQRPLLMVNALNDPLLGENCYPTQIADNHPLLHLETPRRGGHLGFTLRNSEHSYMETSAMSFINEHLV